MSFNRTSLKNFANRSASYVPGTGGGVAQTRVGLNATGGTITDFIVNGNTYRAHAFTSSGSFVITSFYGANTDCELMVCGGGSGAGSYANSGGGGGGVIYYGPETGVCYYANTTTLGNLVAGTYAVTIGAGGAGSGSPTGYAFGSVGSASSFIGTNYSITQQGGGIDSSGTTNTLNNNAGIGCGYAGNISTAANASQGGYGWANGGGGGGWPANGNGIDGNGGGNGGKGAMFRFLGLGPVFVGGGGGGGALGGTSYASDYNYRGKGGTFSGADAGFAAAANSGGGGGANWGGSGYKSGGSGLVIIKYRIY